MQMESMVVFGAQVDVVEVVGAPGLNEQIPDDVVMEALQEAGYQVDQMPHMSEVLRDGGYLKPSSWAVVVRQELIEAGVAAGEVNAVVAAFQGAMIRLCGVSFARVAKGSVHTDEEVAQQILKAKHVPAAPEVKEATGWAPSGEQWREYLRLLKAWLGTMAPALARSVGQIATDYMVDTKHLGIPLGGALDLALGSVLRGPSGLREMVKLAAVEQLDEGSGLSLLQDLSRVVLSPMDEVDFYAWQHPVPLVQAHLVEAGMRAWLRLRSELRGRGRAAVDDALIAREAFFELVGSCAAVKPLLVHLKREYGGALTVQQCITRIEVDSHRWLAEKNAAGGRVDQHSRLLTALQEEAQVESRVLGVVLLQRVREEAERS